MKFPLIIALFILAILSGCASQQGSVQSSAPPIPQDSSTPYRIGVGDSISINVWRNPELSQTSVVRPDGYVSMPLMGDLKADGRRPEELAMEINNSLSSVIRNPEVTVLVNNPTSQEYMNRVRATGQVGNPTSIPHRPGMTVMDLVLQSGGVSEFGAGNRASLQRIVNGEPQWYAIKLEDIFSKGDMSTNYLVFPGDVVNVPKKRLIRGEF
ncbi:MAG: polysaccharide biosynthesis/export family protein [Saccharospirillum sp.]|nr:polysaccharide biosynthesis/export family protein [Saccharospirillum sp.]